MKAKNKELFETHLTSNWPWYLIYTLFAIFIWCYAVVLFTKDKPKEVVTIWVMAYDINSDYVDYLEANKPDYLKHVRVTFEIKGNDYAAVKYQGIGTSQDIVILPESFVKDHLDLTTLIELDTDIINEKYGNQEYYYVDGKTYGIKIFDATDEDNGYIKYTNEDTTSESYYIFLNNKSLHMGNLNNSRFDGALEFLRLLLDGSTL